MQTFPLDDRGSFAWIADPTEAIQRSSAAVALAGGYIVVDPVHADGLETALGPLGTPLGVVTLLDRHRRDAALVADRLGAPRLLPQALGGDGIRLAGVEERAVLTRRYWKEALLWLPDRKLLVCAETLGTSPFYLARDGDRLGVHLLSRLLRVRRAFGGLEPVAIAVGHGPPVVEGASEALAAALAHPVRELPRALVRSIRVASRAERSA